MCEICDSPDFYLKREYVLTQSDSSGHSTYTITKEKPIGRATIYICEQCYKQMMDELSKEQTGFWASVRHFFIGAPNIEKRFALMGEVS